MSTEPDLFDDAVGKTLSAGAPLAARMRPRMLDEVVGHASLLGPDGFLRRAIAEDAVPSMVLYGPPGSGKTTLARVVAGSTRAVFEELSATSAGLPDVRAVMSRARDRLVSGGRTVLFIDEIHRFTKNQQDALLPAVEEGLVTLIGATTENPYYEVNAALVSRMRVLVLESLTDEEIAGLIDRAVADPRGLDRLVTVPAAARAAIVSRSGGDARFALNLLDAAAGLAGDGPVTTAMVERAGGRAVVYDKAGDQHYNVVSAFIKSMRGSDPDAALYWLAVMLQGGEDPKFVARRMIVLASEDIGNADPRALEVAIAVARAVEFVGGIDILVHAVAFARAEDLGGRFIETSLEGFNLALEISAWSLAALAKRVEPHMQAAGGGAIVTLSYMAAERAVPGYNVMGIAKSTLESIVRYLAWDMGEDNVRVNALSAGPVRTLAARGIPGFGAMSDMAAKKSPLRREITADEVADAALFLCSPLARAVTGETLHVDAGYHAMGF